MAVGNEADPEQQTCSSVRSGGIPVWAGVIDNPATSIIGDAATLGDIAFPNDWSADPTTGYSNFFFSINGVAGGVYHFKGEKVQGNSVTTNVSGSAQVATLDVAGPVASAAILAGLTNGTVIRNDGTNWLPVSVQPTGSDNTYVVMAWDFTTSGKAWALVRGAGGLSLTTDSGDTWSVIWP